jgi:hypothetical protein
MCYIEQDQSRGVVTGRRADGGILSGCHLRAAMRRAASFFTAI